MLISNVCEMRSPRVIKIIDRHEVNRLSASSICRDFKLRALPLCRLRYLPCSGRSKALYHDLLLFKASLSPLILLPVFITLFLQFFNLALERLYLELR